MAVFGIPVLHEDDALRAVRAAAEMRGRLDELNGELERDWGVRIQVRTGIHTGEVVAGDAVAASASRRETPSTSRSASRRPRPPGEILLGEPTYRLVRDAVEVEAVEPLELKGKGEPVGAYRLLAVEADAPGRARRLDSPMVGREREQTALHRVVRPRCRRARLPSVHRPRSCRRRQVAPGRRVPGRARRADDRRARPLPALWRGDYLLAPARGRPETLRRRFPLGDRRAPRRRRERRTDRRAARRGARPR